MPFPRDEIPWLCEIENDQVAIVVAHQDDEAIAFSTVLCRCPGALVVHVTDGAPEDPSEWKGLLTRKAYAALRKQELDAALDAIGHTGLRVSLGVTDATAALCVPHIAARLSALFAEHGTLAVFTHAYEGGHPDHDAVSCAVHAAKQWLEPESPQIIEAPVYRLENGRNVWQRFVPASGLEEVAIRLTDEERELKRRMLRAHRSQGAVFMDFSLEVEPLREAPQYDFALPANDGALSQNYARANIDAARWRELAAEEIP